jgi:vacuolar-type H+-ATPase subunit D/Vma8
MTPPKSDIGATIRGLTTVLQREQEALAQRNFKAILEISALKADLADELDEVLRSGRKASHRENESLLRSLLSLSGNNAALLMSLRDNVSEARRRLLRLAAAERSIGVYQQDGSLIPARGCAGKKA